MTAREELKGLLADRFAWWAFRLNLWAYKLDKQSLVQMGEMFEAAKKREDTRSLSLAEWRSAFYDDMPQIGDLMEHADGRTHRVEQEVRPRFRASRPDELDCIRCGAPGGEPCRKRKSCDPLRPSGRGAAA